MKNGTDRRIFLRNLGVGGMAAFLPIGSLKASDSKQVDTEARVIDAAKRKYNAPYAGTYLNRVAFPIGGIGAGMFCLEGTGAISHLSIRNNPEVFNEPAMFAAISIKREKNNAKVLEGKVPAWKKFGNHDSGLGGTGGATWGLPRFENAEFSARFPFGDVALQDKDIPLQIGITGWNPFVPTDADNASLPVGGLEYHFKNTGAKTEECVFSYSSRNFMEQPGTKNSIKSIKNGFVLSAEGTKEDPQKQGDFAIYTDEAATVVDHCWFRGGWFDGLTMAWKTIANAGTKSNPPVERDAPGASLFVPFTLRPGEKKTIRLMMAWYVPNTKLRMGEVNPSDKERVDKDPLLQFHKPWYSSKFKNVYEVAAYWDANYADLRKKTKLFTDTFYKSTLPAEVIEAVAANLTILKSPTVLRQYDGRFWCWEGSGDNWGSCHGSCTHVWNYAQAVSHLFPSLERSLRDTEFNESQNAEGHQMFRSNLPITPVLHNFHAASDGQMGGIMKVHREWRISGDSEWLKNIYPKVQASLDYCIKTWDPKGNGVIQEPHHNTYDIEFWGPTGFATSFYLGALNSIITMGKFLKKDVQKYEILYAKGKKYMEGELYNGEYFAQKIEWKELQAADPTKVQSFNTQYTPEAAALLEKEGPKYQYGTGCLSDGVMGAWLSRMCGLGDPLDAAKTKSHLSSVHQYNFKTNLHEHSNPQRPTYAIGNEGGLLLCSWPKGGMLSLPFVYSNEVWTGIEYQVASHLMLMGEVQKGLDIVRACRDRYDGEVRNPFNEYECGHWYARAMSSYGMLEGLTGVGYDAVNKDLHIDSKIGDFTSFLSTASGFGTVTLKSGVPSLNVAYGNIPVNKVMVSGIVKKLA
ncbi:MAG: hypothetical protein JWR50_2373 [Mucilaginibacter sp.]|nr:hypothetical protein [Mucilaginibacter sp.]